MTTTRKKLNQAIRLACSGLVVIGFAYGGLAMAAEDEEPKKLEKEFVTGSHIKRIDVEGTTPLFVITAEDISNQGFNNVQEVLAALPQNLGGKVDQSFTNNFSQSATTVDLRGFGPGRSLVLVDGRRLPIFPIGLSGTDNFVDLSMIPVVAVDRIEVLTDGASAIYGADAVSGVVNIITRKDYDGVQASVSYGDTTEGGYEHGRIQLVAGKNTEDNNVMLMFEHWDNDALMAEDRDYADSDVANPRGVYSIGGSSFLPYDTFAPIPDPNCGTPDGAIGELGVPWTSDDIYQDNWCGFDRARWRMLYVEQQRTSAGLRFEHEFNHDLAVYGRAGYTAKETTNQNEPPFYGGPALGIFGGDTVPGGVTSTVAPGAPNNPSGAPGEWIRRLVEYGPQVATYDEDIWNVLVGARGNWGSAEWEAGIGYNEVELDQKTKDAYIVSALNSYVNGTNGSLNLYEPIPQDVIDATSYTSWDKAKSSNWTADLIVTGDTPWELSGSNVAYAVFGEFVREEYDHKIDDITRSGDSLNGSTEGGGDRDHYGIGAEFNLPVTEDIEVTLAGRYDNYVDDSDVGDAFSPKIAGLWRPRDDLMLRASWGQSFRAPDMQRLFGADTKAFTTINDPVTGTQTQAVEVRTGANIDLKEEEGENFNIGVVWEAVEDLTLKVDYYHIEIEDLVTDLAPQFIVDECGPDQDGTLCPLVHRDPQGGLLGGYIESNAQNLSYQAVSGVDFTVEYDWDLGDYGDVGFNLLWAYVDSLETRLFDDSSTVENIGLATLPENRVGFVTDWNRQAWGATIRVDWIDEMCGLYSVDCASEDWIDDYTLVSGTIRYDADDYGRIMLGVQNIFDEDPADDPTDNDWPWFFENGGYSNPLGRTWTLTYTYDFK